MRAAAQDREAWNNAFHAFDRCSLMMQYHHLHSSHENPNMPKPNKTGSQRFARIKDHEACNRNDPISFNVKATKDGFIFNTEQCYCDDVIEMQCDHMWQLFDHSFDDVGFSIWQH